MLSAERWQTVERLFHEALARPPAERQAFLDASCPDDPEIRAELDSLLLAEAGDDGLPPVAAVAADWARAAGAGSLVGRTIGGYQVESLIGSGGMGEVYLADDPSLGRKIALKVLTHADGGDAGRIRRFTDEARAASALNHPGILTVYQIGECDGRRFIATEYVDGETLRARLARGPVPFDEAVAIGVQVAGALAAAHHAGIVHRDIKPENLMVRRDGFVKVLDFGIAKLRHDEAVPVPSGRFATHAGAVLGTLDYMAPEQAAGARVDARADIFSLAVVLHEMLTGHLPRELGATDAPDGPRLSPAAAAILRRGLASDPALRYQTIEELSRDLAALGARGRPRLRRRWVASAVAMIAMVAAAATLAWHASRPAQGVGSVLLAPMQSLGANGGQSHLATGIVDAVAARLARLPNLRVVPRAAVGPQEDAFDAARRLGADTVLTGTVDREGNQLRVTMVLAKVADHREIWAGRFDQQFTDIFSVEDTIADRIATNLLTSVSASARAALVHRDTENAEAYDLYLRGREQWARRTPEAIRVAMQMYQRAIALDPNFALAYAGLADCYNLTVSGLSPAVRFPLAKASAARAIALDPRSGPAHNALAFMLYKFEWNWAASEREFQKAVDLQPDYALAHHWYGEFLKLLMRHDESIREFKRAVELDPFSIPIRYDYILALLNAGRVADARKVLDDSLKIDPTATRLYTASADVLMAEGHVAESVDVRLRGLLLEGRPERDVQALRAAFQSGGLRGMQAKTIEQTLAQAAQGSSRLYGAASALAGAYADAQDREQTIYWLQQTADRDEDAVLLMKTHQYDFVRDDPRFQALYRRVFGPHDDGGTRK